MSLFIVLRKSMANDTGYAISPTLEEIQLNMNAYQQLHVFTSREEANRVAEIFFHSNEYYPKVAGSYGLIVEVSVEIDELLEMTTVSTAEIYNNWIASQRANYRAHEANEDRVSCMIVSPSQISSIKRIFIPEAVNIENSSLKDVDFTQIQPKSCLLM